MAKKFNQVTKLSDYAEYSKSLKISHDKMHLKSKITTSDSNLITVNSTSLPNKYWEYIMKNCYKITLSDEDYITYRYQPKMYCFHRYGTTELWSLLLKVNNMTSVTEFKSRSFLEFNDNIFEILNEILILEDGNIQLNKKDLEN